MKKLGIWLDKRIAYLVTIDENKEDIKTIVSKVEQREEVRTAYRDRVKSGFKEIQKDRKLLAYNEQALKHYFKDIVSEIPRVDQIVIFGPSQTAKKLNKELMKFHKELHDKVKEVIKADSMTKNQIRAMIRNYYSK